MASVAKGDLKPRIIHQTKDEIGQFAHQMNHFLDKINHTLQNVFDSAHKLSASASQLDHISEKTYQAISEQDRETGAIASSVEKVSDSAMDIAQKGDTVQTVATMPSVN